MNTGKDPMVGQALELLVPDFDFDEDGLLATAHAGAAQLRAVRRRRRTVAALAFAVLLLFTGAAVAAQKYDLFSFLHARDRNSARFSVSPTRTYRGAAPLGLSCPGAGKRAFDCHVTGTMAPGNRNYQLGMRTDKVPLPTRESMLAALDHARGVDPAQVARVRADLAQVDDRFIRALAIMARIETVGGPGQSSGPSGTERVPPLGVPAWTTCREVTLTTFRCRPLAALVGVPTGAPLYYLQPGSDWRTVSTPPSESPAAFVRQLERLVGHKLTAAESRFFVDFATVASGAGASSGGTRKTSGTLVATSGRRGTALLAPRSLGVRTRVVSATPQPLPSGRLPDGLTRSGTRLYRVGFDLLRADGVDARGLHTIYVYVTRSRKLGVWQIAWVARQP